MQTNFQELFQIKLYYNNQFIKQLFQQKIMNNKQINNNMTLIIFNVKLDNLHQQKDIMYNLGFKLNIQFIQIQALKI